MSAEHRDPPPSPEQDERDRRAANLFLLVAAVLVIGVGVWLANAMFEARRADECIAAGGRNCNPIELPQR
jgi:hypothetical protein